MGNCTGVFASCVGEDQSAIKKVDKDNIKKALAINQDLQSSGLEGLSSQQQPYHVSNGGQ